MTAVTNGRDGRAASCSRRARLYLRDSLELSQDYYIVHAGREVGPEAPVRITELDWWVSEHREVKESTWSSPKVKLKGNCTACHREAEQVLYEDD